MAGVFADITASGIGAVFSGVGDLAKDLREAITGDIPADKQAEIEQKILAIEEEAKKGQMKINEIEAASSSLFVAGWRPAIGWLCVVALLYVYLFKPLFPWIVQVTCLFFDMKSLVPPLPDVPMGDLFVLLGGMLGISISRTFEKVKGVAR